MPKKGRKRKAKQTVLAPVPDGVKATPELWQKYRRWLDDYNWRLRTHREVVDEGEGAKRR